MIFRKFYRTLYLTNISSKSKFIKDIAKLSKKERFELLSKEIALKDTKILPSKDAKVYEIWLGMTLKDIAQVAEKNLDEVKEVLNYVKGGENIIHHEKINDTKLLNQIFKIMGGKTIFKKNSNIEVNLSDNKIKDFIKQPLPHKEKLKKRCPIIVIMGHVDHGKTTLLDQIRKTSMVEKEFGGITQHIGAFSVKIGRVRGQPSAGSADLASPPRIDDVITFLDTPGHAAFSAMRSRGADVTDIAVIVIAAEDGIMDQTVESIKFATEAGVPIIVAINKIDRGKIDLDRIKKQLLGHGVCVEEFGGEVQAIPISALKGTNMDGLLEAILAQAEVMDIKADYDGLVEGVVIESRVDKNRGILSTVLIRRGTLRKGAILISLDHGGDILAISQPADATTTQNAKSSEKSHHPVSHHSTASHPPATWCKVRAMFDASGRTLTNVVPGFPVEVIGWKSLPYVGTPIFQVESEERAKEIVHHRTDVQKANKVVEDWKVIEEKRREHLLNYNRDVEVRKVLKYTRLPKSLSAQWNPKLSLVANPDPTDQKPRVNIVLKGDVIGSVEAILDILATYDEGINQCHLEVLHYGIGPVTPFDIELAQTFGGIIYAFNVEASPQTAKSVQIKRHNVIYKLLDDLILEMNNILPLVEVEETLAEATVNQEFIVTEDKGKIPVAGCIIDNGTFTKKCTQVHLVRSDKIIHKGSVRSLKHFKNDVDSIKKGSECGIMLNDTTVRFRAGDVLKAITIKKIAGAIDWNLGF